jgi:hypothetical protein
MILKISEIQISTEIEIWIFNKLVNFLKNRIKKWEHPKYFWDEETCLIKETKIRKIKTTQSETVGVKMPLSVVDLIWNHTNIIKQTKQFLGKKNMSYDTKW